MADLDLLAKASEQPSNWSCNAPYWSVECAYGPGPSLSCLACTDRGYRPDEGGDPWEHSGGGGDEDGGGNGIRGGERGAVPC